MKSKYRFRRILSGVMAAVTILSTVISPLTVYASEEPKAAEPPAYESVKDQLDENEVVKATDLELEVGQDFDVSTDFTNLEIKDESKVKVTFQKAENDAGENFSTSHADTYHAVYYVEPVNQNHPVYQIGRNLIVLWSSIFVTLMANKIGGLQFGIYRNCQISSRVFHTAVAALPLTKANRSDFE